MLERGSLVSRPVTPAKLFARHAFDTTTKADAATEECAVVESN